MSVRTVSVRLALAACLLAGACQSTGGELTGLAEGPPLDFAVLVTGGAFLSTDATHVGTFVGARSPEDGSSVAAAATDEPIAITAVLDTLRAGRVFHRVEVDADDAHRHAIRAQLRAGTAEAEFQPFLQDARDRGFDLLLVVEELQDGPIEAQGINARWPVTFATWILLGVGVLIPDHTFYSRAQLRVTLRDLQTGRTLDDHLLVGGPIELSLTERSDVWGLLTSILVPPFWVGDDPGSVAESVRTVTARRLLLQLARELKGESVRQRLREGSAASLTLVDQGQGPELVVDASESLSSILLRCEPPLGGEAQLRFAQALLASMRRDGDRFRYQAALPAPCCGRLLQVLAATIRGSVASATLAPRDRP